MARRRKSTRVPMSTYIAGDLRAWLAARAKKEVRSLSQYVERVLDEHRRGVEQLATAPSPDGSPLTQSEGLTHGNRT